MSEIWIRLGSTKTSSALIFLNTSVRIVITSSRALITSVVYLFTIEYDSNLNFRYTKLGVLLKVITFLYERTLKQSMIDKKIDSKEAKEFEKVIFLIKKLTA